MNQKIVAFIGIILVIASLCLFFSNQIIKDLKEENVMLDEKVISLEEALAQSEFEGELLGKLYIEQLNRAETLEQRIQVLEEEFKNYKKENLSNENKTKKTTTKKKTSQKTSEREILAKLLYREAGSMSWEGKIYTCSAILNLGDLLGRSVTSMAHDSSLFSTASRVDSAKPNSETYKAVDYVLNGNRIPEICYFRTKRYHSFGTPVCVVDGHYFSKP